MPDTAQFEQLGIGTQPDEEESAAYRQHAAEFDQIIQPPAGTLTLTGAAPSTSRGIPAPAAAGVPFPDEMWLGALRDGRLRVISPFRVRFSRDDAHVVAEAPEADEFGFGTNGSEALADLQRALVALYLSLEEDQQRLGPDLQRVWQTMRRKVGRAR